MKGVRRFAWSEWLTEPFRVHEVSDREFAPDIGGGHTQFNQILRNKAWRNGLRVAVVGPEDSATEYRVRFQFYHPDDPRPVISPFVADVPGIVCQRCGLEQARAARLMHVGECLFRNPKDPTDPDLYASHWPDPREFAGFRRIGTGEVSWSLETGPVNV